MRVRNARASLYARFSFLDLGILARRWCSRAVAAAFFMSCSVLASATCLFRVCGIIENGLNENLRRLGLTSCAVLSDEVEVGSSSEDIDEGGFAPEAEGIGAVVLFGAEAVLLES